MRTINKGNWIDKNGEFYEVVDVQKNGCSANKVKLKPNGHYKVTNENKFFTNEELKRLLVCEY